jgi:hypothetical protein
MDFRGWKDRLSKIGERGQESGKATSSKKPSQKTTDKQYTQSPVEGLERGRESGNATSSGKPLKKTADKLYTQALKEGLSQDFPEESDKEATFKASIEHVPELFSQRYS